MKLSFWVLLTLVFFVIPLAGSSPCPSQPNATFSEASALQFEQSWLATLLRKDSAALDCMLDDSFEDSSSRGELRPKAQVLRELPHRNDSYGQKLSEMRARLFGNMAVVCGVNVISDQQGHEVARIRFTDVLRFADHQWHAVAAQETMMAQQEH